MILVWVFVMPTDIVTDTHDPSGWGLGRRGGKLINCHLRPEVLRSPGYVRRINWYLD